MVRRIVVGAHYGLREWLAQRITAVVMIVYTVLFAMALIDMPRFDFESWQALWRAPWMRYATLLFTLNLLYHAWVGVRNIFMDYVKPTGLRLTLHALVILALIGYGVWSVQILWGL
jgi:succinate dehydrogenase / fumarate reductase membrane anchor subunit